MTVAYLLGVAKIVLIDLALAGDNAVVIALAVRTLPRRHQRLGRVGGTLGAVVMRVGFIVAATYLLAIPLLRVVGGVLLLGIAVKLVRQPGAAGGPAHVRSGTTLREAIWIIVVADVVMSLDNVVAVASIAAGDLVLVVFGIGLSIPIVVFASGVLTTLMNRHGWIVLLAGGVLGEVAGKMLVHDDFLVQRLGPAPVWLEVAVRMVLALGIVVFGWLASRRELLAAAAVAR
jgi:YjbE family integral membrane protein